MATCEDRTEAEIDNNLPAFQWYWLLKFITSILVTSSCIKFMLEVPGLLEQLDQYSSHVALIDERFSGICTDSLTVWSFGASLELAQDAKEGAFRFLISGSIVSGLHFL